MSPFINGFRDELTKEARLKGVAKYISRLKKSKDLRGAIRRSAVLGAGTGALTAGLGGNSVLGGAALGAVGGGVSGGAFPAWFQRSSMHAPDEKALRRLLSKNR